MNRLSNDKSTSSRLSNSSKSPLRYHSSGIESPQKPKENFM